ncbi:MAG: hypothetical protein QOD32_246 [Pyrinomonadaceae bacterium]|nr:hypothetical protein [Pyrinomonadaceae bacterium]
MNLFASQLTAADAESSCKEVAEATHRKIHSFDGALNFLINSAAAGAFG